MAHVYIVRHGETQANKDGIIQGHLDTALNEEGINQAELVAVALKSTPFTIAFSSDLQRATKTAEMILQYHPDASLTTDEQLRERFLGDLQGQSISHIKADAPSLERVDAMESRAIKWWKDVIVKHVYKTAGDAASPQYILVVSHGGFIGTLVRGLLGGRHISQGSVTSIGPLLNTAVTEIELDPATRKGKLERFGDVAHLTKAVFLNSDEV